MFIVGRNYIIYFQSLSTRAFRITEHMKLGYIQPLYKLISLFKVFGRFSSCTDNHIYTDKGIGHQRLDFMYLGSKKRSIIPATHQFKHLITSRLQRNMEMRHKTT